MDSLYSTHTLKNYVYIYQQLIVYEIPQEQPGIHCQKHTIRHTYVWKHVNTNNYRCFGVINYITGLFITINYIYPLDKTNLPLSVHQIICCMPPHQRITGFLSKTFFNFLISVEDVATKVTERSAVGLDNMDWSIKPSIRNQKGSFDDVCLGFCLGTTRCDFWLHRHDFPSSWGQLRAKIGDGSHVTLGTGRDVCIQR